MDSPALKTDALEWCDVFGKVNLDPAIVPARHADKVVVAGPIFPVRIWGPASAALYTAANFFKGRSGVEQYGRSRVDSYRWHLLNSFRVYAHGRLAEEEYRPEETRKGYVFFSSGLWEETGGNEERARRNRVTNQARLRFVRICRELEKLEFEGGFWERKRIRVTGYESYTSRIEYSHAEYIEKTKASTVVFNTPSVLGCHSWKLAEFLALGKAIVSLPTERALPAPLLHGEHVHYVDGSEASIREAVRKICEDDGYREHLERQARAYYEEHLAPSRVVERLIQRARLVRETAEKAHATATTSTA